MEGGRNVRKGRRKSWREKVRGGGRNEEVGEGVERGREVVSK